MAKDSSGTSYQTNSGKPATYGTGATSNQGGQRVNGTIQGGGYFVPNKK